MIILRLLSLAIVTLWQNTPIYRVAARKRLLAYQLEQLRMELDDATRERDRLRLSNARHVLETTQLSFEIVQLQQHLAAQTVARDGGLLCATDVVWVVAE